MKADLKLSMALEDIEFKYERMAAMIDALQALISEGPIDVVGLPENVVSCSLCEISCEMSKNNKKLMALIRNSELIK